MIGVTVTFDYSGDFDRERVIKVAAGARGMFEGMPGLRLKVFTLDQERQRAANFYVWEAYAKPLVITSLRTITWHVKKGGDTPHQVMGNGFSSR